MERVEHRCAVCGHLLYYTATHRPEAPAYCTDRPCILYPTITTSRSEDPTRASYVLAVVESTPVNAHALSKAMGMAHTWASGVVRQQRKRWEKAV